MVSGSLEAGLYVVSLAALVAAGLGLLWSGLFGDRSKGRPRCPECWCDLAETLPSRECPECGYEAASTRQLYRNRRRWGRAVTGAVLLLVLALAGAYTVSTIVGWAREQAAIEALVPDPEAIFGQLTRIGPKWLVSNLPERYARYFDRVIVAAASSDAHLAECAKLRHLKRLSTDVPEVTDAGLSHLRGLRRLRTLTLARTRTTDDGLAPLLGLKQLQSLDLSDTGVTDAGVAQLQALPQLRALHLSGTRVTDAGLVHLQGLQQLESLSLAKTAVTDAGLVHLGHLIHLQRLVLSGTSVTAAGLADLTGLTELRTLMLRDTGIDDAGKAKLKQTLPNARIYGPG